jgi:hypothetical protein
MNMAKLEDLRPDLKVKGIIPGQTVSVVDVKWRGPTAVELFYKRADGQPGNLLLYRNDEPTLEIVQTGRAWSFNAEGELFRLVAEAYRIRLAHLFDPVLAVHTSIIEPLTHQITGGLRRDAAPPAPAFPAGR